ncbi:hypothetical protein C7S16_6484 [Burkholderia thailandensis]|uniref:Uncharacterized protein n=1 Tax=Burkholderia thailandensis TaxID=57975 RepID=A0AAW9CNS9_BURTH|nr:hypothetical protein [Burkholderia thailandensis]
MPATACARRAPGRRRHRASRSRMSGCAPCATLGAAAVAPNRSRAPNLPSRPAAIPAPGASLPAALLSFVNIPASGCAAT